MEMPEDDQPPQHIWLDTDALEDHFEKVREKYKSGSGGAGMEAVPEADLDQNEFTKGLR